MYLLNLLFLHTTYNKQDASLVCSIISNFIRITFVDHILSYISPFNTEYKNLIYNHYLDFFRNTFYFDTSFKNYDTPALNITNITD